MAKKRPWGKILLGAAVISLVGYGVVKATAKEEPKPKKELDIPPGPGPDDLPGLGTGVADVPGLGPGAVGRSPMPSFEVPLPQTAQDHVALDQKLCEGYWSFEVFQGRDPSDAAIVALQLMVPEVEWPSVPGDHVTLRQLEQLVRYRADQIAYADAQKLPHENYIDFCGPKPKQAVPKGGGGVQWQPPGG